MKKLFLLLTIASIANIAAAQKPKKNKGKEFEKVSTYAMIGKNEDAKLELDKAIADPETAALPEAQFWKYKIYAAFAKDEALSAKYPGALLIADEAFAKYAAADPAVSLVSGSNSTQSVFDVYGLFNKKAINAYNTKVYDSAGFFFGKSAEYLDVIIKNKWTDAKISFDTTSILYAGAAYESAKLPKMAAKFFGRLVESKVGGEGYMGLYRFMMLQAIEEKSRPSFDKYLRLAKEVYPSENWDDFETEFLTKAYTLKEKVSFFDQQDADGTLTVQQYIMFGEAFANLAPEDKEALDSAQQLYYQNKAIYAFKKASEKQPKDGLAAYNVGVLSFNEFSFYDDRIRDNRRKLQEYNANRVIEKDPKKKAASDAKQKEFAANIQKANTELEKSALDYANQSIQFLEKAYNNFKEKGELSKIEKTSLNRTVDFLATLFQYKRDKSRGKDVKAYDEFDAKFKLYDEMHGKFKD